MGVGRSAEGDIQRVCVGEHAGGEGGQRERQRETETDRQRQRDRDRETETELELENFILQGL